MSQTALIENNSTTQFENTRIVSLNDLVFRLQEAQRNNLERQEFSQLFSYSISTLELDQETVARKFKISRPTVSRWRTGTSAPHQLGRKPVFTTFEKMAKEKIRQYKTSKLASSMEH